MGHRYFLCDVFTDRLFGGNPLAVFPDGAAVPEAHMSAIARELNLSECVFVLTSRNPDHALRMRIFTPGMELPFAGHPTVGTACTLARVGILPLVADHGRFGFEQGVGPIQVTVTKAGDLYSAQFAVAQLPVFTRAPITVTEVAALLSVEHDDILQEQDFGPEVVSCGVPFLFVPVRNRQVLAQVHLNLSHWQRMLAASAAPHVYVFTTDAELPGSAIRSRMFAPGMGITEDPATGGAAAPLAGYLARTRSGEDGTFSWTIEQGFELGRPSILEAEVDKHAGKVTAVRVGGKTVPVGEGMLHL